LPKPVSDVASMIPAQVMQGVNHALSVSATGTPQVVHSRLGEIIKRYKPDEIMVTGMIHDHAARVRSFQLAAEVLKDLVKP
jgi:alkanesulfonate monooxygenase SsuD/methylene tetrahydromethanopterin reductase-like flavin-dependent oxidoreductase (luciferase family)